MSQLCIVHMSHASHSSYTRRLQHQPSKSNSNPRLPPLSEPKKRSQKRDPCAVGCAHRSHARSSIITNAAAASPAPLQQRARVAAAAIGGAPQLLRQIPMMTIAAPCRECPAARERASWAIKLVANFLSKSIFTAVTVGGFASSIRTHG